MTSINSLQSAVVLAQRKVQQDRDRVARDEDQLEDSRNQLLQDNQTLSRRQLDSNRAQAAATPAPTTPRLDRAIDKPIPASLLPQAPTLNTLGQTIGKLINVVA